ncbi:hypothetical protein IFR04_009869 [Cadophora malorum]|uniref:Uncharacterized protein n=1 Tax=Cadophora malorum TaxID=108018 RepID=A0A8H7TBS5_9HELO|nr:hypothetical protein IFR04_009869 [Cadophora malorum]
MEYSPSPPLHYSQSPQQNDSPYSTPKLSPSPLHYSPSPQQNDSPYSTPKLSPSPPLYYWPSPPLQASSPPMQPLDIEDFQPGEFYRGRTANGRVTCRCVASRLNGPCGHDHTDADNTTCRKEGRGNVRTCCDCGGSAYSPTSAGLGSNHSSGVNIRQENPSASRSSSQERKKEDLSYMLGYTPTREKFRDELEQSLDHDEFSLLDTDRFKEDPSGYVDDLVGNDNPRVRRLIEGIHGPRYVEY